MGDQVLKKQIKKSNKEWTFTFFGTAIGSGILFIPLQAGISGVYVSVITMVLAFSVTYFAQKYYCTIIAKCQFADSYNKAIEEYWGYSFSSFISIIFAIQLFVSILIYSTGLNTNFGEFLLNYNITNSNLSSMPIFPLLILVVLTAFLVCSETFLIKFLDKLTTVLILLLVVIIILFIPFWNVKHFFAFNGDMHSAIKNALMSFPLYMGAINFYPAMSPMIMYYRKKYPQLTHEEQVQNAFKLNKQAIYLLGIFTGIFVLSSAMTLTPDSVNYAITKNLSALAVVGYNIQASTILTIIKLLSYFVIFFALTTSFYGLMLGAVEVVSHQIRFPHSWSFKVRKKVTTVMIMLLLWIFTIINLNIIGMLGMFTSPCTGLTLFVIPTLIIFTNKKLKPYRRISTVIILLFGLFIMVSFFIGLLM
ncbi:MAG: hypothetical protein GY756_09100 [bacterium]|nr:hypothetical protein [bacterium]